MVEHFWLNNDYEYSLRWTKDHHCVISVLFGVTSLIKCQFVAQVLEDVFLQLNLDAIKIFNTLPC